MKNSIVLFLFFFSMSVWGQANGQKNSNVIYKYKEYESFDLGDLEIKGNIIAPGDLSVQERARKKFERNLFDRRSFAPEVIEDIKNMR